MAASFVSLLHLLSRQQSDPGGPGLKLALLPNLLKPLSVLSHPYHHCAATANTPLALYLARAHGPEVVAQLAELLVVANLTSRGVNGNTPWTKSMAVQPSEVARMAGHATTAAVLELLEKGTPLSWSPAIHHTLCSSFRDSAKRRMLALSSSPWFLALPGPARMEIIRVLFSELFLEEVWWAVSPEDWRAAARGDFGPELNTDVSELLLSSSDSDEGHTHQGAAQAAGAAAQPLHSWYFRCLSMVDRRRQNYRGKWISTLLKVMPIALWLYSGQMTKQQPTQAQKHLALAFLAGIVIGTS
mmetsp:Transcript_17777/g.30473  ORF Transcript_17777/g.30473 Transcript_17777/m.30473 type:complete len:300 (+) Transcript_17777:92-991(+)